MTPSLSQNVLDQQRKASLGDGQYVLSELGCELGGPDPGESRMKVWLTEMPAPRSESAGSRRTRWYRAHPGAQDIQRNTPKGGVSYHLIWPKAGPDPTIIISQTPPVSWSWLRIQTGLL